MKIILIFTISILSSISSLFSQTIDIQIFGDQLGKAIVKNDSILYKSLIVPKKSIIEKLKKNSESTLNESELNQLIDNVHANYQELIDIEYMMSFFNLTTKRIFLI